MTTTCEIPADPRDQTPAVTFDAGDVPNRYGDEEPAHELHVGVNVYGTSVTFHGKPDVMADYFATIAEDLKALADAIAAGRDPADVVLVRGHEFYRHGIGMPT